jgi:methionyl-tRNA formyltransferase
MQQLRVIFYGTPEFASYILEMILSSNHQIVGVVTAPDRPAGRGQKLKQSSVKETAVKHGITVLQPTNLKSEEFQQQLKKLNADVQVVVAFRMLPKSVWQSAPLGTFNLHASLLPAYRGAAPINWAIINQEKTTGVSTFFIDEKIDTGHIIDQQSVNIAKDETAGSLHDKLMHLGAELTVRTLDAIASGEADPKPQPDKYAIAAAPKLDRTNTMIHWDLKAEQIDAMVRGLYPYPIAKAMLLNDQKEMPVKIHKVRLSTFNLGKSEPGTIILADDHIYVSTSSQAIEILEMQLPGKRCLSSRDIINGHLLKNDARFIDPTSTTD